MGDALVDSVAAKLHTRIGRTLAEYHLPGAAVGVVRGVALAWNAGFGFADIATERRPDPDTVYGTGRRFTAGGGA
jgi:CubicO group peptidase (beta-lactamase class C family)